MTTKSDPFVLHAIESLIQTGKSHNEKTWLKASPHDVLITDVRDHHGRIQILLSSMGGKVWDFLQESDQIFNA